jgi:hypothetical protein
MAPCLCLLNNNEGGTAVLIKSADDKQPQIDELEALLGRSDVSLSTRRRIEQEIRAIRAGASGERDAAYAIEFNYGSNKNRMTIHDLRIEVDGRVAQIDHLIINRLLDIWVCESKHFAEGVAANERGEWEAFYGRRRFGIESPVEQNRRHIAVLTDLFAKGLVPPKKRLGITIKPVLKSLVLVSNDARISRPKGRAAAHVEGLDSVIKVDKLYATIEHAYDKRNISATAPIVSSKTIEGVARQLAALHKPAHFDWAARFGLPAETPRPAEAPAATANQKPPRAVCANCERPVSDKEVAFCRVNQGRFGGAVYCFDCQKLARKP